VHLHLIVTKIAIVFWNDTRILYVKRWSRFYKFSKSGGNNWLRPCRSDTPNASTLFDGPKAAPGVYCLMVAILKLAILLDQDLVSSKETNSSIPGGIKL
jgi:hypothetical protein